MSTTRAAAASALFFLLAPGVVAGLIPGWLTDWKMEDPTSFWAPMRFAGLLLLLAGVGVLLQAFVRFVIEGMGTPAPVAPTERLVVGGLYGYVRNPMYLAVLAAIVGQALVLGQLELLAYGTLVAAAFATFVHFYEEPTLKRQFGDEYEAYRQAVPAWLPRKRRGPGFARPAR